MRLFYTALFVAIAAALPVEAGSHFDWSLWRDLPVQGGGRQKPLDTLGWETLRLIGNRSSLDDPETGERFDATALYLAMLFDWQGWSHPEHDQLLLVTDWRPFYFHLHKADKWDRAPLLRIDYLELREKLGLANNERHVSPAALSQALIVDERSKQKLPFSAWGDRLVRLEGEGKALSKLEEKGLELANRLWSYQNHRMGRELALLPIKGSETDAWMPIAHLILTPFDEGTDPDGRYRKVRNLLQRAWTAYHKNDAATFDRTADELKTALRHLGPQLGEYPGTFAIDIEVAYNRWAPFRFAWMFMLLSAIGMFLYLGSRWQIFYPVALSAYVAGLAAMLIGFVMRILISGRPPVTNMYESVVYVGFGVTIFGLIFELIYRKKYTLTAASAVATVALILADNCPTILDPSVRPLEPVLRSNFWLVTHVMTITLSYAAFALAVGIANITLGYFLFGSRNWSVISALSRFTYKAMQVGVLLLAAGVILGGVWADYSWGRFWGWDPKEVWALVALLGYLCVLHARFAGWVGHRGLAALAVVCFSLVVMAWYGVNFVLGAGLHSYGFGGGGQGAVYTAVTLELLFAGVALIRSRSPAAPGTPQGDLESGMTGKELLTTQATASAV